MKKKNKKVKKCCEGCGREVKCDESDMFPLCHDCATFGAETNSDSRKGEHPYE